MLVLFSFILVLVGCANWLTIGLLQFDFVAGIFGSQSNIFSRIIYVVIGVAATIIAFNVIKNKGKIGFNFKKLKLKKEEPVKATETGSDFSKHEHNDYNSANTNKFNSEASRDNYNQLKSMQNRLNNKNNNNK